MDMLEYLEQIERSINEKYEKKRKEHEKRREEGLKKLTTPQKSEFQFFSELMQTPPTASKSTWKDDYDGGDYGSADGFSWDYYHNDDWGGNE